MPLRILSTTNGAIGRAQLLWREEIVRSRAIRRLVRQAGCDDPEVRDAAAKALAEQLDEARPQLKRALQGGVPMACGAAIALERAGDHQGIEVVLRRSYEEEWLLRSFEDGYPEGISSLCWISGDSIGAALQAALTAATTATQQHECITQLSIAISGLRILLIMKVRTPFERWESAFLFGRRRLTELGRAHGAAHCWNMTDTVRAIALRGLILQYPQECAELCAGALSNADISVARFGIAGLYRLGGADAISLLQELAFTAGHPLGAIARRALEGMLGEHAEPITLLRSASPEMVNDSLLRSATPVPGDRKPNLLQPAAAHLPRGGSRNE